MTTDEKQSESSSSHSSTSCDCADGVVSYPEAIDAANALQTSHTVINITEQGF